MTLHIQFVTLGMMCAGGLSLGGLFDVYRVLAGQLRAPGWVKSILDLVYWFTGTLLVFALLYESNWGEVRPFIFLGLGIGIIFYFLLFSRPTIWVIRFIIRVVIQTARLLKRLVILLVIRPIVGLYRVFMIILGFLLATAMFLYRIVLQLCHPVWKLLLWLLRPLVKRLRFPVPGWMKKTGQSVANFVRRFFGSF
ncbi:spore cortex biosynthesis protein YabQ [Paenibacillus sp. UNCCL117]|uniref:spore cortex biosynthesis protein YabQ n=1 Tax=unclassified Paenibacillus TaxID=185978 RepID=UPI0008822C9B|nr:MULTISPECIES: spore cortex biosynthesis protein YabQ [unclassified Paenibacillus]SDE53938.1 spore cortex biosynthesis protein YabQ [Paenibacillus sp. cl123]SFW68110.1 spore cortex biosynthesis protein YabQ [Paenibacillus sp. UNCCL117]